MNSPQTGPGAQPCNHPVYIVMGVSGSGKTTIGRLLAQRLNIPFYDADDFHPPANLAKLQTGIALSETDREPWLKDLSSHITQWAQSSGAVLACSALKHTYRSLFRKAAPTTHFIYLTGSPELITQRLHRRSADGDHLISDYQQILRDQFHKLETPTNAFAVNIDQPPKQIVDGIVAKINSTSQA